MNGRTLIVGARYRGPARSANGGYLSGRFASLLTLRPDEVAVVTLRRPPPLDTPLHVVRASDGLRLEQSGSLVAEAVAGAMDVEPKKSVGVPAAMAAEAGYGGAVDHPFPSCFVCGVDRTVPDGLGLAPGPVVGADLVACAWRPAADLATDGTVAPEYVWAALDCPGGWAVGLGGRPFVLGRMAARTHGHVVPGADHVVQGWVLGRDGRKAHTASAVYDETGRVIGTARATWLEVDPATL